MVDGWLIQVGVLGGLGLAVMLVWPWWRWQGVAPRYRAWGFTIGLAAVLPAAVWWETGGDLAGALAGMGAFALGGWLVWGQWQRADERKRRAFEHTLTQLLTGQKAWDAPTIRYLVRTAAPEALPRLRATLRYMYQSQPELRPLLAPFVEHDSSQ